MMILQCFSPKCGDRWRYVPKLGSHMANFYICFNNTHFFFRQIKTQGPQYSCRSVQLCPCLLQVGVSQTNRIACVQRKRGPSMRWNWLAGDVLALGRSLPAAHGFHVPTFHSEQWPFRPTVCPGGIKCKCLKARSNTFLLAFLELTFKISVYLPLQLKGMEKEDFAPRKRQKTVVESPRDGGSDRSGFRLPFG